MRVLLCALLLATACKTTDKPVPDKDRPAAATPVETDKPMRTFTVWLSDDADRVPLRVLASTELGDVTVDLTDYSRP